MTWNKKKHLAKTIQPTDIEIDNDKFSLTIVYGVVQHL